MNLPSRPSTAPKLPGVIDTLSAGYQTLNKHPYLLLAPVLLDVLYWLGPRLSAQPIAQRTLAAIQDVSATLTTTAASAESVQNLDLLKSTVEDIGKDMNLVSLLSSALSIPSVLGSRDLPAPSGQAALAAHSVSSVGGLLLLVLLLYVSGVVLGAIYMALSAHAISGEAQATPATLAQNVLSGAARYLRVMLMLLIAALIIGLPASLVIGVLSLISPLLGSVLLLVVWTAMFWLYIYLFFTAPALFVSRAGPMQALLNSITVVRRSSSSALGLIILMFIVSWGLSYVWATLGTSALAVGAGILGNAYIGTGMTLASMIFYRDRIGALSSRQPSAVSSQ